MQATQHYTEYIKQAKMAEKDGDIEEATALYEKAIKQRPLLEQPYNRLMIIYRKNKKLKEEIRVIDKALDLFIGRYEKKKAALKMPDKVARLSKAILKTISKDGKAFENSYPQPVQKWLTRKKVVEKKLK